MESSEEIEAKRKIQLNHFLYQKQVEGGVLKNETFSYFFTDYFGLDIEFYEGKRILDVGCGPRGTLEWAIMAEECIGLDPLVDEFWEDHGLTNHAMQYIKGVGEAMPFEDNHFDLVSIYGVLPSVEDPSAILRESRRVLKPGGFCLLMIPVNNDTGGVYSHALTWEEIDALFAGFTHPRDIRHYEFNIGTYESVLIGTPYNHGDLEPRQAVVTAKFQKV